MNGLIAKSNLRNDKITSEYCYRETTLSRSATPFGAPLQLTRHSPIFCTADYRRRTTLTELTHHPVSRWLAKGQRGELVTALALQILSSPSPQIWVWWQELEPCKETVRLVSNLGLVATLSFARRR
ncbi:hypothetical protein TIFTF001_024074 [Ficus carica]|uniref:Uncharacterized protein n=1 Tax=Ficus carica TaxID=3494 RepID=A0AA88AXS2_FICCA|nr:hypothetical protein TIFTF001_024074 [Ficus carica]